MACEESMTIVRRPFVLFVTAGLVASALSCSKEKPAAPSANAPGAVSATGSSPDATSPAPRPPAVPPGIPAFSGKPNLVLITLEATRPDHLGCYGYPGAMTPNLDQLAREGERFTQATTVTPLTLPSHASILTGEYPARHGVRDDNGFKLRDSDTTLAEFLKSQGYATGAAIGSRVLARESGLQQGFDIYAEPKRSPRTAPFVIDDALMAVDTMKGGPFFLWVQLNDPHAPYNPPPGLQEIFAAHPYDGEIAWADAQLKRLFDRLHSQGVWDRTMIVATADEGESLGEHGEETHGLFLYDGTLKVPLIVRYPPRIAAGSKFEGLISSVDLAPTLLELMGLPPMPGAQGESCAARILGKDTTEREAVYAESFFGQRAYGWGPLRTLRSSAEKFVDGPEPELYDLHRDPAETINRAPDEPKVVAETWRPSLEEALRVIGDKEAGAGAGRTGAQAHRDVRGLVAANNLFLKAQLTIESGHPEQAAPLLDQALLRDPGNPAVKTLRAALRGEPATAAGGNANTFAAQFNRGNALFVKGQLDGAAKAFSAALALNPASADTHYLLGRVRVAQQNSKGAEEEFRAAVAADPKLVDGWNALGILLDKSNRRPEALDAFSRALDAFPDHPDALFNRSKLELLSEKLPDARRDLDRLLKAHPDYSAARFLEAHLCVAEKNTEGAKAALNKFLALPNVNPQMKAAATDMLQKLGG
jgi:arylsulfatase A-like enzyme/Tfp pilus assembly protein PilF